LEWFIIVVLSLIALNYQFLFSKLDKAKSYLSFILLFGAFGNILNTIPSGGRFMTLFSFFAISFIVIYYKNMYGFVKNSIVLGVPVILLFIIVSFRLGFDYVNIFALVGNPLTTLFLDNEISLMDLIK
jgi:hypothetical protein